MLDLGLLDAKAIGLLLISVSLFIWNTIEINGLKTKFFLLYSKTENVEKKIIELFEKLKDLPLSIEKNTTTTLENNKVILEIKFLIENIKEKNTQQATYTSELDKNLRVIGVSTDQNTDSLNTIILNLITLLQQQQKFNPKQEDK